MEEKKNGTSQDGSYHHGYRSDFAFPVEPHPVYLGSGSSGDQTGGVKNKGGF
jgi:hypothetical protein